MVKDPYRYFRIEANELLEQMVNGALELEKGSIKESNNPELVMRLLRLAHTLKGAARVVKQIEIANLAHGVEETLSPYKEGNQRPSRVCVDNVLAALDAISGNLKDLPAGDTSDKSLSQPSIKTSSTSLASAVRTVRADLVEVDSLLEGLGEIGNELGGVRRHIEQIDSARGLANQLSQQHSMPTAKLKSIAEELSTILSTVERNMSFGIQRIDRELRETRDAAERLRLIPITSIFNSLERTARDVAHNTGKQVEFNAIGGDVRIEGTILDTVQNALIQLVRNAVAHGIELGSKRELCGKSNAGNVTLTVERRGYRVSFCCKDDGGGVDLDAVRKQLQKKGWLDVDINKLTNKALMTLLFKGGISTSAEVTEISGRGIGLDLVSDVIQKLNGELVVNSEVGRGTSIEIIVPLSLAALEVLIVKNNGQKIAIPLDAVRRTLRITQEEIIHRASEKFILFEGQQIPFVPLRLGEHVQSTRGVSTSTSKPVTSVVVTVDGKFSAVAVDRLCGMDTIVMRPLPALCPADPIILGVHLDTEGNPRMVINPDVLVMQNWLDKANNSVAADVQQKPSLPILIIDDSLTTRMLESSILESAGYTVELAACAEDGMEMASRNDYALFLVDVEMPGMDGFSFVKRTKEDPVLRDVPSILVSSCDSSEDRRRGIESGASAYIVKGEFDQVQFLGRVTELVQQ